VNIPEWLKRETGRQHVNRTAHKPRSIWDLPLLAKRLKLRKHKHTRENARRRRQIASGMLKIDREADDVR